MVLTNLSILNYKNIREANLTFSPKVNCLVGLNGQGKTNILDAIYLLSFTKSAFSVIDSQNITHGEDFAMVQGEYTSSEASPQNSADAFLPPTSEQGSYLLPTDTITCGIKRGVKKTFKRGQKAYTRLLDHIGLIPLVMVSPEDSELIAEGSDERRRFMDSVISQYNRQYLEDLTTYNALLKNRNALLKQLAEQTNSASDLTAEGGLTSNSASGLLEVYELQMTPLAERIYRERETFIKAFTPIFNDLYREISGDAEQVSLRYISQLQDRDLAEAFVRTRQRDLILGWTSQGIHKDDIEMLLLSPSHSASAGGGGGREAGGEAFPIKRTGSQGQQKTYLLAMKLAQAIFLSSEYNSPALFGMEERPEWSFRRDEVPEGRERGCILLLDDIFDKLDNERVERIIRLVNSDRFGQIFITDTDRQHLTDILGDLPDARIFTVSAGEVRN